MNEVPIASSRLIIGLLSSAINIAPDNPTSEIPALRLAAKIGKLEESVPTSIAQIYKKQYSSDSNWPAIASRPTSSYHVGFADSLTQGKPTASQTLGR